MRRAPLAAWACRVGWSSTPSPPGGSAWSDLLTAVRTLSRSIQERAERGALRLEVRRAETQQAVLARVMDQELDPHWAAEMLLEEASAAFLVADLQDRELDSPTRAPVHGATYTPLLPHADVPTGFIWPAHTGRTTLRSLAGTGALSAKMRVAADGSVRHAACGHVIRSHTSLRFEGAEAARQALVRAARERTQLEGLLVPETVLVAEAADDGAWWLWTLMPDIAGLPAALADAARDGADLAACGGHGGRWSFGARHAGPVSPRLGPESFGVDGALLLYLGEVRSPRPTMTWAAAVAGRCVVPPAKPSGLSLSLRA